MHLTWLQQSQDSEDSRRLGDHGNSPTGSVGSGQSFASPASGDDASLKDASKTTGQLSGMKEEDEEDDLELDNFISGIGS